jgi:hypothetical protein
MKCLYLKQLFAYLLALGEKTIIREFYIRFNKHYIPRQEYKINVYIHGKYR